jgi:UDP-N-acetylmuramate: L-alanyl-gamma-D-glutamyl-meso-diaminopimelate ligase
MADRDIRHIHMIAICGTGMGAVAGMLKSSGFKVTGSDENVYPPISTQLASMGIDIKKGYSPENLSPRPDLIVVGNAVSRNNPEVVEMLKIGVEYVSFPGALRRFFLKNRKPLVVAGTHGKTTTTSLLAWILTSAGREPGFLVGGVPRNFSRGYGLGSGEIFAIEGDEYDTAFFDKGPKFLHYAPYYAVITSLEFDHADIYKDLDHMTAAFSDFIKLIPADGLLVANDSYPRLAGLLGHTGCRIETYGPGPGAKWKAENIRREDGKTVFSVTIGGLRFHSFSMALIGAHNVENALAAIAMCKNIGLSIEEIRHGLETFEGVARRQEIIYNHDGITIIEDFAHHPTAVKATLGGAAAAYPGRRLVAVFEPRSNTTRRKIFQKEYVDAFSAADRIILAGVFKSESIPEGERLDPEHLVSDLVSRGKSARFIPKVEDIVEHISGTAREGDVIVIMSNGGFGGIYKLLPEALNKSKIKD